ncbi:hypothetical protein L6452_42050 [Arctium lappa]|uniref:Uncharacterized protein n=1 Tax=Arctium lappa TaxID=4217 RepID=A0ACB8XHY4_ARCLA|nr:hypothetical protein L6452_42050 [Arctium lappa]
MMKNLRTGNFGKVRLADHRTLDITGIGDRDIKISLGTTWTLKDVRRGECSDQRDESSRLWHKHLDHISEKGMKMLVAKGKFPDLKSVDSEFCESCVLGKEKKTVPGTPQQNGVAERMNKTLNERAKSMRLNTGIPKTLWADAINTAAYLINRGISVPLNLKIPEEEWKDEAVKYEYLKVFGCSAYDLIKDSDKLDTKAKNYTFIGYGSDSMDYRLWDFESRKVVRSKHATFNKVELYKDRSTVNSNDQKEQVEFESDDIRIRGPEDTRDSGSTESDFQNNDESKDVHEDSESSKDEEETSSLVQPQPVESHWVKKSTRVSKPPEKHTPSVNYILLTENGEPESYSQAVKLKDSLQWERAMKEEMGSLNKNKTCVLTKLLQDKRALQNKWVFRFKEKHDGSKWYKARLVVKGFQQKKGIDYNETFSPVVKMTTIRLIFSIVAAEGLHLEQLDTIARNKKDGSLLLSQEKYIGKVLERFKINDERTKPRNTPLGSHFRLTKDQFPRSEDDKVDMAKVPYAFAIGSLMYVIVYTRQDIAHAVGVVSRFMSDPGREHWKAFKWLLRYLKGTSKFGLCFKGKDSVLSGYTDAYLSGCKETFKSTTGYVFTVGGTIVSWMSRLQKSVALSTTEAEYMTIAEARKELVWLKDFLEELGKKQVDYSLHYDNESAVKLAKNPVYHGKTKHIGRRYHFVRELIRDGTMNLKNISGAKNPTDMFTKSMTLDKLKFCMTSVGLHE